MLLPFESEYSANLRFAATNVVGVSEVRDSFQRCRWPPRFGRPARAQSVAADGTSRDAAMADDPATVVEQYLFSDRLRTCPVCWGEHYHSYLYQLIALPICPVHGCSLVTQCLHCGADLPSETVDNLRAHRWYLCRQCGKPASGEGADSTGFHSHGREVLASALAKRLSPIASWLERVRAADYFSPQLLSQIYSKVFPWEPAAFLGSVAQVLLHGPVTLLTSAQFPDITVLRWNLEILPNSLAPAWTYEASADRMTWDVLWSNTCGRVEDWAAGRPGATHGGRQHRSGGREAVADSLRARFRSSIALQALMASQVPPPVPFERHGGGVPRLGLLAYFLGVWATMIWKAWFGHPLNPSTTHPPFVVEEAGGTQQGWVLFPSVPGLPIAPFSD